MSILVIILTREVVSQLGVEGLVRLAVVDVVAQLDVVSPRLASARRPRRLLMLVTTGVLRGRREAHDVLGLVGLVDIALARPQGEVRLSILGVTVVEVDKEFLKE